MTRARRIGILTGGGDVPGLNSVIKSVVYNASEADWEVIGIRRGWRGLTNMRQGAELDGQNLIALNRANTRAIDRTGGTILHTSRTNPSRMVEKTLPEHIAVGARARYLDDNGKYDLTPVIIDNIAHLGLDYLITIGGDDTLSYSKSLAEAGVPVIAIPKTMDNDVQGTEYCIGFSTAITRAKDAINRQRTTISSHERIGIFRIFGREAGFSALWTAYATSGRCIIPEYEFELDQLLDILVEDRRTNPAGYAFVIASEGAIWKGASLAEYGEADAYGHRRKADIGFTLANQIRERTGEETTNSELTYDLRAGEPDAIDQMVAATFAGIATDLILAGGISGRMTAVVGGRYTHIEIPDPALGARRVDVARFYNAERLRPQYHQRLGQPVLFG